MQFPLITTNQGAFLLMVLVWNLVNMEMVIGNGIAFIMVNNQNNFTSVPISHK
jgi:hypothetical protein